MRTLIEIVLTLAFAFLAVKLGWMGAILFVVLYLVAFSFKLPFLSRRVQVTPRFIFLLAVFLTFALLMRWVIGTLLAGLAPQGEAGANTVLGFLFGSPSLILFWSLIGGILVAVLVAVVLLLPYGLVAGPGLYSQYENYKGHEWEAAMSAVSILLGINRGTWIVSNGQAEVRGESGSSLARFGGPGILLVQEGHAVILEVSGRLSRVVGRGITMLRPFERISMVVPLYTRTEKLIVEKVATKDKILIDEFEILVFHKVDSEPKDECIEDGQFLYNEDVIRKNIWSPSGADWRGGVRSVAETSTRDVIGRYDLDEIIPVSDAFRTNLKKILADEMNKVTKQLMGVVVGSVDINRIKIPKESEDRLLETWLAEWNVRVAQNQREAMIRKGEAEAVILKLKEVAWAQAQKQLVEQMAATFRTLNLSGRDTAAYLLSLRFLETLEKMASDPATKILLPNDSLALIQKTKESIVGNAIS